MSYLTSILSNIDPSSGNQANSPVSKPAQPPKLPKPTLGQAAGQNGATSAQPVKRKAEGQLDTTQTKMQRKDAPAHVDRVNGAVRPGAALDPPKSRTATPTNPIPYRGTAGLQKTAKPPNSTSKPPVAGARITPPVPRTSESKPQTAVKPPPATAPSASISKPTPAPKPGSYAAMLARAKEAQQTKATAPPVKVEPTNKIITKRERMRLKEEAKATAKPTLAKAKSTPLGAPSRSPANVPGKAADVGKEKRKPADLGYSGTMRPKQPVGPAYTGTARSAAGSKATNAAGRSSSLPAKPKPKDRGSRYDGYANWSDLDDEELEEEDAYESDLSDMEGGMWDVEQEEKLALAAARREDAEALKEENEHKRAKEERRRKLAAMASQTKRKY